MIEVLATTGLPPVPGLRFRGFAGATDFAGMAAANLAARIGAGVEEMITADQIANDYANLTNSDLGRDLVVIELDGEIVGYVRVEWLDQNDGSRSYDRICILKPDLRGRGIGDAMLQWAESRIREIAAGHDTDRPISSAPRTGTPTRTASGCSVATATSPSGPSTTWFGRVSTTSRRRRSPSGSRFGR